VKKYKTKLFEDEDEKPYKKFLNRNNHFLWYSSLEYKLLLESYLNVKSMYLIVKKDGVVLGSLPLMESHNPGLGTIINSLPFYGSNGGFLLDKKLKKEEILLIMTLLLESLLSYVNQNDVAALTLITSPFDIYSKQFLEDNFKFTYSEHRIGQITSLPSNSENLLTIFDNPRPRNIRKAIKSGVSIRKSNLLEDLYFLVSTHQQNIESIGGKSKSKLFFERVIEHIPKENYSIFIAEIEGKKVAALLLFYFNKTVEYFTPCSIFDYRKYQPTSLMIFEAMKDAIEKNYKYWNWGGTWESQKGVYEFKKKWGALDKKYYYYSKIINPKIFDQQPVNLLSQYPNFYSLPFEKLRK
jgi:hypothetical protein